MSAPLSPTEPGTLAEAPFLTLAGLDTYTTLEVRGEHAEKLLSALKQAWNRCLIDEPVSTSATVTATLDDTEFLARTLQTTTQDVTHAKIKAGVGRFLMLHAGAVTHPKTGAALVMVAPGGTGKTTMTKLLGRTYGYVTDETVAISADKQLHPYPKPLSLRVEEGKPKAETSPDDLDLLPVHPQPWLHRIVLLNRDGAIVEPHLETLTVMDAIAALCPESSSLSALPRPLHALADLLDSIPPVLRVHYAEADSVLPQLTALLEDA